MIWDTIMIKIKDTLPICEQIIFQAPLETTELNWPE